MANRLLFLTFASASLVGCHSVSDNVAAPSASPAPAASASSNAPPSDPKAAPAQATDNPSATASPAATAAQKSGPAPPVAKPFTPPFQDRTDLFEPPHRSAGVARREEEQGATVELKGFVNVNGEQVVLAIDGVILPIPEGGEKYGVQVISIKPPSVVLQRGRSRWTATLD
jgi:hypothetical protein